MELTEREIYQKLLDLTGLKRLEKEVARIILTQLLIIEPAWLFVLPESLLDKLGIKYDHQFDDKDQALARAIKGRCARRILR